MCASSVILALSVLASVSFEEALAAAAFGPRAEAAERARLAQEAGVGAASSIGGNPTLTLSPGAHVGKGVLEPAVQLNVTQTFRLSGLGAARGEANRADVAVLRAAREALGLQATLSAAMSWLETRAREQSHAAQQEEVALAERLVALIERGVRGGGFTRIELSEAKAYASEARLLALQAEGEAFEAEVALAEALHTETEALIKTHGAFPSFSLTEAELALASRIDALPAVRLERLHAESLALRSRELEAENDASYFAGVSGQLDNPREGFAFVVVGATLPVFDRSQRSQASLVAEHAQQVGAAKATRRSMMALVARALHEVEHTREVLDGLTQGLLPSLLESVELGERALAQGETTVPDVLRARRALTSARARETRAEADHAAALVRIRLLSEAAGGVDEGH